MKFGNFHDEGGSYFGSLELENNSKSDNKVLFFAPGSTDPVLYEGTFVRKYCESLVVTVLCRCSEAEGVIGVHRFGHQGLGGPHTKKESGVGDAG